MSLSINNNFMALNTSRHLNSSYSRLSVSMRRLSSGLRVGTAADDAAGLAIRELMRADITALHQGIRNANDAISMIQTADGALAVIDEKLIRMKELAEQAATGTYDSTQRLMIDSEFQAMASEIDRIAKATDFNGIKLLDGSLNGEHNGGGLNSTGAMKIHFGTGNDAAEDYYYVEIGDCTAVGLGLGKKLEFPDAPPGVAWINEAKIDYAGRHVILDVPDAYAGRSSAAFAKGLDFYQLPVGLENITVTSNAVSAHPFHKPHVCLFTSTGTQITGPQIAAGHDWKTVVNTNGTTAGISSSAWWNRIDRFALAQLGVEKGVFHPISGAGSDNAKIATIRDGGKIQMGSGGNSYTVSCPTGMNEIGSKWPKAQGNGSAQEEILEISRITNDLVFFIGGHDNPGQGCNRYRLRIEADITEEFLQKLEVWRGDGDPGRGTDLLTIETQQKAQEALVAIDGAIVKKDQIRAHLGALQNRFENTVTNLSIQAENLQASESRISDADVAEEMTEFVRNQILAQSAVAMLTQANSLPRILADLLAG